MIASLFAISALAISSDLTHTIGSPALGSDFNPTILIGCDGPALFTDLLLTVTTNVKCVGSNSYC
jgi:hypothetical protein